MHRILLSLTSCMTCSTSSVADDPGDALLQKSFLLRKKILFPANFSGTPLDRQLQNLSTFNGKKSAALRQQILGGHTIPQAWQLAVEQHRPDVMRAMLLLLDDQEIRNELGRPLFKSALHQAFAREGLVDAGLAAVIKEYPYHSSKLTKDGVPLIPEEFNGQTQFPSTSRDAIARDILCRHLVIHHVIKSSQDAAIKFPYQNDFISLAAIQASVQPATAQQFSAMRKNASETHLVDNTRAGRFLASQFRAMEQAGQTTRVLMGTSTIHTLSIGLRIKNDDGHPAYVVKCFDPNSTTHHARNKVRTLDSIATLGLDAFIDGDDLMEVYYPEARGVTMMFVRDERDVTDQRGKSGGAANGRTLTSMDCELDGTVMSHLMGNGFTGTMRQMADRLAKMSVSERLDVLTAKDAMETPGFFTVMSGDCTDTISVFSALLASVAQHDRTDLVRATDEEGTPALFNAMSGEYSAMIDAYAEPLALVAPDHRANLLAGKNDRDVPALFAASVCRHSASIRSFGKLLTSIPQTQRAELLAAKDADDLPALCVAFQRGYDDVILAFAEASQTIPENERTALFAAEDRMAMPGLFYAFRSDHAEAIGASARLLELVPDNERMHLLAATSANGTPGLYIALQRGHADSVRALAEPLQQIPQDQRAQLLVATNHDGKSGLFMALENGHTETVRALADLLPFIPDYDLPIVLAGRDGTGLPGILKAIEYGRTDTIIAYGELVRNLSPDVRAGLFACTEEQWMPPLRTAMQRGYGEAFEAYKNIQ